jgi:hypothetical protein
MPGSLGDQKEMKNLIVVMLRCHRRSRLLHKTLSEWIKLNRSDVPIKISLMCDRPTSRVLETIRLHQNNLTQCFEAPFPLISFDGGDRFMEAANYHYKKIHSLEPEWVVFADDDRWFEPSFVTELKEVVNNPDIDLWYAKSLFFWERPDYVRTDFFEHNSVALFRFTPNDEFDTSYNQAPATLHTEAHARGQVDNLKSRLLDYGYCGEAERIEALKASKEVGRLDQVTLHLMDENPILEKYVPKT